jgi:hypothetical protein
MDLQPLTSTHNPKALLNTRSPAALQARVLSEQAPAFVLSHHGQVLFATQKFADMLGYTTTALTKMDLSALLPQPFSSMHGAWFQVCTKTTDCALMSIHISKHLQQCDVGLGIMYLMALVVLLCRMRTVCGPHPAVVEQVVWCISCQP